MDSMEKVVLMFDECHNLIGVANSYSNAVKFLVERGWLDEGTTREDGKTKIPGILGIEWKDLVINWWNLEEFNKFFDGVFELYPEEVYNGE